MQSAVEYRPTEDQVRQFWRKWTTSLFGATAETCESLVLNSGSTYKLCLASGMSAKQLQKGMQHSVDGSSYQSMYWNMMRMGGRDPAEIKRAVTLQDALDAIGADSEINESARSWMGAIEKSHSVILPETLKELFGRRGICDAICESHPNNPRPPEPSERGWEIERDVRQVELDGDLAIPIMLPHQGDHDWVAVFDSGACDARIYLRWYDDNQEPHWQLTAPSIGMFVWDLAQTGLAWYRETGIDGPPSERTDIGLAVAK